MKSTWISLKFISLPLPKPLPKARWHEAFSSSKVVLKVIPVLLIGEVTSTKAHSPKNEEPLNVYGYSKLAFDQYMREFMPKMNSTAIGLRYFNVYGQREIYKGKMASMVYQLYRQVKNTGKAKLFEGTENYSAGEQRRDFVCVKDVVDVNLFFGIEIGKEVKKGILNCGTGKSRTFNNIAKTIIEINKNGEIEYIPIPDSIRINIRVLQRQI